MKIVITRIRPDIKLAVLMFSILLIGLHIIVILNKTYHCASRTFHDQSDYKLFISSIPMEIRSSYVEATNVSYFDLFPQWIVNIFYAIYLLLAITGVSLYYLNWETRKKGSSYGDEEDRLNKRLEDAKNKFSVKDITYYGNRLAKHRIEGKYQYYK